MVDGFDGDDDSNSQNFDAFFAEPHTQIEDESEVIEIAVSVLNDFFERAGRTWKPNLTAEGIKELYDYVVGLGISPGAMKIRLRAVRSYYLADSMKKKYGLSFYKDLEALRNIRKLPITGARSKKNMSTEVLKRINLAIEKANLISESISYMDLDRAKTVLLGYPNLLEPQKIQEMDGESIRTLANLIVTRTIYEKKELNLFLEGCLINKYRLSPQLIQSLSAFTRGLEN